jgi:hypothetical protein
MQPLLVYLWDEEVMPFFMADDLSAAIVSGDR